MTLKLFAVVAIALAMSGKCRTLMAQGMDSSSHPSSSAPTVAHVPPVVMSVRGVSPSRSGIDGTINVQIDSLQEAVRRDRIEPRNFVLYLNGHPIWNAHGQVVNWKRGILEFKLERADTSQAAWVALLGSPTSLVKQGVAVGVGYGASPELESSEQIPPYITLMVLEPWRLFVGAIVLLSLAGLFLWLVRNSNIIRDSSPPFPPEGFKKPYSLARLQMAVWFFLVAGAFIFLFLITHSIDTLNQQALLLIGIGAGTALGATLVDNSKRTLRESKLVELRPLRERLKAEINALNTLVARDPTPTSSSKDAIANLPAAQLEEKRSTLEATEAEIKDIEQSKSAPVSTGLIDDILTDAGGIGFHRFQMFAWTVILGLLFVYAVWERLAMPEFSATLLSLMGISAGTYLGFKGAGEKEN
jgi:hypothetical protein